MGCCYIFKKESTIAISQTQISQALNESDIELVEDYETIKVQLKSQIESISSQKKSQRQLTESFIDELCYSIQFTKKSIIENSKSILNSPGISKSIKKCLVRQQSSQGSNYIITPKLSLGKIQQKKNISSSVIDISETDKLTIKTDHLKLQLKKEKLSQQQQQRQECILSNEKQLFASIFVYLKTGSVNQHYEIGKFVGKGGYGKIFVVYHIKSKVRRALKQILKSKLSQEDSQKLCFELTLLKQMDHPNIMKIFELYQDENYFYIICEYYPDGDLFDLIAKNKDQISEKIVALFMKQIFSALSYLHSQNIVHRDIKLENIMVEKKENIAESVLKIIDFGFARKLQPGAFLNKSIGTLEYMAPEIFAQQYNEKCDI